MKEKLGKAFLAFAIIGGLTTSIGIYILENKTIFCMGLVILVLSAIGVFVCARQLMKWIWELVWELL